VSYDREVCTVKTCKRRKGGAELVCPAHWKLVPRSMKKALWEAEKIRSKEQRAFAAVSAAARIVDHLESLKVVLPDEPRVEAPSGIDVQTKRIITP
jgi:hypothetical protein